MDIETSFGTVGGRTRSAVRDPRSETLRSVVDRLSDPYLTDHDRWVLTQFARFLDGRAPQPDPRVASAVPRPPRGPYARIERIHRQPI